MRKRGISLILLVITIIVIVTLAGSVIHSLSENNPIDSANEAKFKSNLDTYNSGFSLAVTSKILEDVLFDQSTLNAVTWDGVSSEIGTIKEYIPNITKEDAKKFEIREGKLVYVGYNTKESKWAQEALAVSAMNVVLPDDTKNTELKTFITEWTTNSVNESITLPLVSGYSYDFTVDYGDGSELISVTDSEDADKVHTYATAGKYIVKISGKCESFSFANSLTSASKITKLIQWGVVGIKKVNFYKCSNIAGNIPIPSTNSFVNTTDFSSLFCGCVGLTGNIPKELFANAKEAINLSRAFDVDSYDVNAYMNLTGTIPEYLFVNNSKITSVSKLFKGCSKLTGTIPENLFHNNTKIVDFSLIFFYCSGLTGTIPENLFANNPSATNFASIFYYCNGLTGTIPENLFVNNPDVTNFANTFFHCIGLAGTIPENLFLNNIKAYNMGSVFGDCSGLTGTIPENLFANNPNVIALGGAFQGCSGLTGTIPENLFANNIKVNNFSQTFRNCIGLTGTIPENLFINNPDAAAFFCTFYNCSGLTGEPLPLWNRNVAGLTGGYCYSGCTGINLTAVPATWK